MKSRSILAFSLIAVSLATATVACGPAKPTVSAYLGKWNTTANSSFDGSLMSCSVEISKVGDSFVAKATGGDRCDYYAGIYTLTPEGNLKKSGGFPNVVIAYDKEKNQPLADYGDKPRYLTKAQ
jgi:hypothetical protein